jgi:hypothetical protein
MIFDKINTRIIPTIAISAYTNFLLVFFFTATAMIPQIIPMNKNSMKPEIAPPIYKKDVIDPVMIVTLAS